MIFVNGRKHYRHLHVSFLSIVLHCLRKKIAKKETVAQRHFLLFFCFSCTSLLLYNRSIHYYTVSEIIVY